MPLLRSLALFVAVGCNAAPTETASDSLTNRDAPTSASLLDAATADSLTSLDAPVSVSLLNVPIDHHKLQILAALVPDAYREDALLLLEEHELDVLSKDDAMALLSAGQTECIAAANIKKSATLDPYRSQTWCSGNCDGTCAAYCKAFGDADGAFYNDMMACIFPPAPFVTCVDKAEGKIAAENATFGETRALNRYKLRVAKC